MIKKLFVVLCATLFMASPSAPSRAEGAGSAFALDAHITLNAYQGLVEEHLTGILYGLRALAATGDVQSADWDHIKGSLGQFSKDAPNDAVMWFAKPDGSYATVAMGPTDKNLKDRAYFSVLMAGKDVNDALVVSKTTGIGTVVVATPVVKDGKVIGALGASISLEKLAKLIDDTLGLPQDVVFYALSDKGQTALHRDTTHLLEFPSDLGEPTLKALVEKMLIQPEGTEEYDFKGAHKTAFFKKSTVTGWVFVLGFTH
jgi:hypothetical protein